MKCILCGSLNTTICEIIEAVKLKKKFYEKYKIVVKLPIKYINYYRCNVCSLSYFDPSLSGGEDLYEDLQKFDWYYVDQKDEYELAKNYIDDGDKILEIGAGKGAFGGYFLSSNYLGLEFNDSAIKSAKMHGIRLIKESIEDHSINHVGNYDVVVSFQVLEHVNSPESFILGAIRCLRKGGNLILAVPNHSGICGLAQDSILDMPPHHISHWNIMSLSYIAQKFNLSLLHINQESISEIHRPWAKKIHYEIILRKLFIVDKKLLSTGYRDYLINKISSLLSRYLNPKIDYMNGHTIMAIFKKND